MSVHKKFFSTYQKTLQDKLEKKQYEEVCHVLKTIGENASKDIPSVEKEEPKNFFRDFLVNMLPTLQQMEEKRIKELLVAFPDGLKKKEMYSGTFTMMFLTSIAASLNKEPLDGHLDNTLHALDYLKIAGGDNTLIDTIKESIHTKRKEKV